MVTATRGVLIRCDIPTKVFITHLNESRPINDKIIIDKPLDDETVLIHTKALDFVKEEIRKYKQTITYQAPFERKVV